MATTEVITKHSLERVKKRCNLKNNDSAAHNIQHAIARGKRAEDCTSWEKSYLSKEAYDNCTAIAYNSFCYIISDCNCCVTVYPLPRWFGKPKRFDGKKRIRDYRRYCNSNPAFVSAESF